MVGTKDDRQLLRDAVLRAGKLVLRAQGHARELAQKAGNEPLSESDLAANEFLRERLTSARPGYGWLSEESADDLISDISEGVYLTELIGMGVNTLTGDYSRGAAGFLFKNGKIGHPVTELTVAGNLIDMFAQLTPASDLEFRYGVNSPTVKIDSMMVAGS